MNFQKIRAVFFKELRDMLRDRRTIFASAVIPVLLYPLLTLTLAEVTQMAKAKLDQEEFAIAVLPGSQPLVEQIKKVAMETPEPPRGLLAPSNNTGDSKSDDAIEAEPVFKKKPKELSTPVEPDSFKATKFVFKEMTLLAARDELASGKIRAILQIPQNFEENLNALKASGVVVEYDRAERISQSAYSRLRSLLERYEYAVVQNRMKDRTLAKEFLHPFTLEAKDIAKAEKLGGSLFGSILPLIFIVMLMTGALHPAIDMTAGEKERSTLETLVGSPARPLEIITGKFLAVAVLSLGNAALNVASFAISISAIPLPANLEIQFPWSALPLTLVLLVPLAMFFSALLLMVSSFAANSKEAQIFCLPVFMVPMVGMIVATTPGIELQGPLLIAPVVNTALLIKEMFLFHGTGQQFAFVFISNCLYAVAMLVLASRVFAREEVLFSAQGSLRLFLSRRFFKPTSTPRPGDALLLAALLFPLNFYVQAGLQKVLMKDQKLDSLSLAVPLLVALYGLFLIVPLSIAKYLKAEWRTTFQWSRPTLRAIIGALLMGASTWVIAIQLSAWQGLFWPTPNMDELSKALKPFTESTGGVAFLIFLVALTPAICEEHFFRGFLQTGLGRKSKWGTILLVGAIFGFFHFPVFRQPITALIGVVLAWTAWEAGSLWPGVLIHFMHNSLSMICGEMFEKKSGDNAPSLPMWFAVALVVFVAGLALIKKSEKKQDQQNPPL